MNIQDIKESKNKNEYEKRIKKIADTLDERLSFLKNEKSKVEKSAIESYESKIRFLSDKRDKVALRLDEIKSTSQEKWNETYSSAHEEIKKISSEAEEAYVGMKNGFSYLFEKLK
ncbi:MAG: hypothetical protein ABJF11_06510 [Reichenbachiella sp.]|uniref:hypothetical protein n=1 Tax=Reichenbachiella sp. TaxID=2184521 RepID=UPI00326482F1